MANRSKGTSRERELESRVQELERENARLKAAELRHKASLYRAMLLNREGKVRAALREVGVSGGDEARGRKQRRNDSEVFDLYLKLLTGAGGAIEIVKHPDLLEILARRHEDFAEDGSISSTSNNWSSLVVSRLELAEKMEPDEACRALASFLDRRPRTVWNIVAREWRRRGSSSRVQLPSRP